MLVLKKKKAKMLVQKRRMRRTRRGRKYKRGCWNSTTSDLLFYTCPKSHFLCTLHLILAKRPRSNFSLHFGSLHPPLGLGGGYLMILSHCYGLNCFLSKFIMLKS